MFVSILNIIMTSATAIIVSYIGYMSTKQKKSEEAYRKHHAEVEKRNASEKFLQMQMINANLELSDVIAIAVTGGHTNGNVEEAQKKAAEPKKAYYKLINREYAEETTHLGGYYER